MPLSSSTPTPTPTLLQYDALISSNLVESTSTLMLGSEEETMNRKRRLLLQQSAKQSKLLRRLSPQPQQQNKRARIAPRTTIAATTKMTVSFDTMKGDEIIVIPSLDDYTQNELESSYFSKNEYANIIQRVHQTVKYLRRKDTSDSDSSAVVVMEDENNNEEDVENENENDYHCVRGLETYAEEYVGNHRKRVQRISKSAVFRYQKQQLRLKKRSHSNNKKEQHVVSELAEIYKRSSKGCQDIANRWGYFDAIDAGIGIVVGTDAVAGTVVNAGKTTTAAATEVVVVPTTNVTATATTVVRCISDECIDQNHPKKNRNSSFRNSNSNSNIIITPIEKREDVFATATATATATTAAAVTTMTMMMNNSWKNEFSKTPVSRKVSY